MAGPFHKAFWRGGTRSRLVNIGHLLTGNAANIVIGLPAIILTARALGPASYGVLALILTYAQVIKRIADFQVWQPLIRFGASLDVMDDREKLMALLKYGVLFDLCSSVGSWLFAMLGILAAIELFDLPRETVAMIAIYATVLLFNINGSPTAILRMANKYRTIAYVQLIAGVLKLLLCGAAYLAGAGVLTFVCIWALTDSLAPLLVTAAAGMALRRQRLHRFYRADLKGLFTRFPGLWRFTWSANFSGTLWSSAQMMDTLLVGWLTDPASAGLYYFAKRIARLGQQAAAQVQAVVYPDITRLWAAARYDAFRRLVMQTELIVAGFGLLLFAASVVLGARIIAWTAGPEFGGAAPLLIVQSFALMLTMSGTVMRSALLAMGRAGAVLLIVAVATLAFQVTAIGLLPVMGPMGANVAHVVLGVIWLMGLGIAFRRALSTVSEPEAATTV
ncbi:oligosaccharide flippase family protein [Sphingomonas sp. SUN019]|uniref:lipopolysaccharide biosynthesis protein n=1 Tax=Sphingomonas sp. SUN019 TaxID=2937788 RepID=UPI002164747B|nr:oligosaccharide flippase family protein [Sphingomonas sp. SUN019]UVO49840.1 oligosaccharide flippase family protein [Sphingomonas sp. SUN019]